MGNPLSWLLGSLIPVLIGVFGLLISGQERESQDFELAVDLLTGDCRERAAGLELADLFLFDCQGAGLSSYVTRSCRLGGEYRPIIQRLRDNTARQMETHCSGEIDAPREEVAAVVDGEDQAVGALSQQNSLALIEEIYGHSLDLSQSRTASVREEVGTADPTEADLRKKTKYDALVQGLNPRVLIHIRSEGDRAAAELFRQDLMKKTVNGQTVDVPPPALVRFGPREPQLRVLKSQDVEEGEQLVGVLQELGCPDSLELRDISYRYEDDRRIRRRTYEAWFTRTAGSSGCLQNYPVLTGVRIPDY